MHRNLLLTLITIATISFAGYWGIFETHQIDDLGKTNKGLLMTLWFLAIGLIGYLGLLRTENDWAIKIWIIINFFAASIYLVNGLLYFFYEALSMDMKLVIGTVRNFFLTPLPFAIIVLLLLLENKKPSKD